MFWKLDQYRQIPTIATKNTLNNRHKNIRTMYYNIISKK